MRVECSLEYLVECCGAVLQVAKSRSFRRLFLTKEGISGIKAAFKMGLCRPQSSTVQAFGSDVSPHKSRRRGITPPPGSR
jgi:hypothetical protein